MRCTTIWALVLFAPSVARGDASMVATAQVETGFTNNVLGVPETEDPTDAQVESDLYTSIGPGVAAAYEDRRAVHNLAYFFSAQLYAQHSEANSYNNRLGYQGLYYLTPVSTGRVDAGFASGRINSFNRTGQFVDDTDELPRGDLTFVSGQVAGIYTRQLSPDWTMNASTGIRGYRPTNTDNVSTTYAIPSGVGVEKSFRRHILGTSLGVTYTVSDRPGVAGDQQTATGGPQAFWTWDMTRRFSTYTFAGLTAAVEAPEFLRGAIFPVAGTTLNFTDGERGQAAVSWTRTVNVNLFTSDLTVADRYSLRGNVPMPFYSERASLNASVAYRRGRFLDLAAGERRGRTEQVLLNVGAAYAIDEAWGLSVRYQNVRQVRSDPGIGRVGIGRQTILAAISGRFPSQVAAQVPAESVRVDEQNAALDGGDGGGF